jgi:hypothetical protein
VASERQIAANRRNALRSTGPRSASGKNRASRNALRHGLAAARPLDGKLARAIDRLARKLLAGVGDVVALAHAQSAAEASLDVARARHIKVALIERVAAMNDLLATPTVDPVERAWQLKAVDSAWAAREPASKRDDPPAPVPKSQLDRYGEALRRALPDLIKLDRYERRAVSRRAQAIRKITILRRLLWSKNGKTTPIFH